MQMNQCRPQHAARAIRWMMALGLLAATPSYGADATKISSSPPQAAKPDKSAIKASSAAVQAAIEALEKELLAHTSDAKTPLRAKCNYFTQNPPGAPIVPEVIVEAISITYSSDSSNDSYIKWQLLSGAPPTFEPDMAHLASIAYLNSGKPLPRPGLSTAHKKELDLLLRNVKSAEDAKALTEKLGELIPPWQKQNGPVLAYRDELYSRLPQNGEALVARLEDDAQRVEAGYESEKEMKATTDAIEKWIDTNPAASHLQILADQMTGWMNRGKPKVAKSSPLGKGVTDSSMTPKYVQMGVGNMPPSFPPTYYENVEFVTEPAGVGGGYGNIRVFTNFSPWKWVAVSARQIDRQMITDLAVTLEEYAKTARAAEMSQK